MEVKLSLLSVARIMQTPVCIEDKSYNLSNSITSPLFKYQYKRRCTVHLPVSKWDTLVW